MMRCSSYCAKKVGFCFHHFRLYKIRRERDTTITGAITTSTIGDTLRRKGLQVKNRLLLLLRTPKRKSRNAKKAKALSFDADFLCVDRAPGARRARGAGAVQVNCRLLLFFLDASSPFASAVDGNFEEIARQILKKASDIPSKKTFTAQNYMFHVQNDRGVTFLCVAEAELGHRIPYAFLNDIKDR